jgi:hypothetical protein
VFVYEAVIGPSGAATYDIRYELATQAGAGGQEFGHAVLSLGDQNFEWDDPEASKVEVAVGSPFSDVMDGGATLVADSGIVELFYPTEEPDSDYRLLEPPIAPEENGRFGYALAKINPLSGRGRFVVGAPGMNGYGTVFAFDSEPDGSSDPLWNAYPSPWNPDDDVGFGFSVAYVRTVYEGLYPCMLVGAPFEDSETLGVDVGAVYLFSMEGSGYRYRGKIFGEAAGDLFGFSVDGLDDLDVWTGHEMIIGAPYHDLPYAGELHEDAGKAYVYQVRYVDGYGYFGFELLTPLTNTEDGTGFANAGDRFGWSVRNIGNQSGTGVPPWAPHFAVGAPYSDPGGLSNAGSVTWYAYNSVLTSPPVQPHLVFWRRVVGSPTDAKGWFGRALEDVRTAALWLSPNTEDVAISAPREKVEGVEEVGQVYLDNTF